MQQENGLKTWQWVVTAIVIVVLIVIGIFVFGKKGEQAAPSSAETAATSTQPAAAAGVNTIIMSDQYPGDVVYVSSLTAAQSAWVVIHKDNNGQPGDIIGSAHVDAGTSPVKISVSSPIIDGGTYYAMLHSDDGSKTFNAATDLPLKDANGNIIMRVFHGSATAGNNLKG